MATPSHAPSPLSRKRVMSDSELRGAPSKKQKRHYRHIHNLQRPLDVQVPGAAFSEEPSVDQLLTSSIGRVLNEAGFEYAEAVAMDGINSRAEEYLLHLLSSIRQSMHNCRRTHPVPQDFEYAFRSHNVAIDSLRPLMQTPRSLRKSSPHLPTPPPEEPQPRSYFPFLGDELSGEARENDSAHIPGHFPKFPSRHTYQQTDVFTKREIDPRKVREQATEEGRLGEEALRKLSRAAKDSQALSRKHMGKKLWGRKHESMETMFAKTLKAVSKPGPGAANGNSKTVDESVELPVPGLPPPTPSATEKTSPETNGKRSLKAEMGPIVNYDRVNWRRSFLNNSHKVGRQASSSAG